MEEEDGNFQVSMRASWICKKWLNFTGKGFFGDIQGNDSCGSSSDPGTASVIAQRTTISEIPNLGMDMAKPEITEEQ